MQSFEEYAEYILKNAGHNKTNKRKQVHIIVDYPLLKWNDFKKYLMTLTWMTGIGWSRGSNQEHNVIFADNLDDGCNQADDYDYALVSYVGTVYRFPASSTEKSIYHYFDKWIESEESPCKGHILWHPNKRYGRLHLQSMFLDLKHWRSINRPTFGKWSGEVMLPERSESNIHDDYTPLWLKPSDKFSSVDNAEMADYISAVLKDNKQITNFSIKERNSKYFTYPQREELSAPLKVDQERTTNILYRRNTSSLSTIDNLKLERKYDVIYAPAAGSIAEYLYDKFGHNDTKLVILDNHKPSIKWKQSLYGEFGGTVQSIDQLNRITRMCASLYQSRIDDASYKPEGFNEKNDILFPEERWIEVINKVSNTEIKLFDFIEDQLDVDPTLSNLVYLTNIFSYIFVYHKYSLEQLNDKFNLLLNLPNTTIIGQNPFRLNILHENHSS